jgi:thioredoxin-like negative regulator of GroEL
MPRGIEDRIDLRTTLDQHRMARADQIEAMLWILANEPDRHSERRELATARAVLESVEAALARLGESGASGSTRCPR